MNLPQEEWDELIEQLEEFGDYAGCDVDERATDLYENVMDWLWDVARARAEVLEVDPRPTLADVDGVIAELVDLGEHRAAKGMRVFKAAWLASKAAIATSN